MSEQIEKEIAQGELSPETTFSVIEFAKAMSSQYLYNGMFTPELTNSRMKDINMNPLAATEADVAKALKDPKNNERNLMGFSEFFEFTDMIYKRTLNYLALMPSFDLTYNVIGAEKNELSKPAYKKDLKIVRDFIDKFDYKAEFKKAMKMMIRQETYHVSFRNKGSKYVLQELPREYCKITGRSEYGFLFDFNMYWFMIPSVSVDMYADIFKEYMTAIASGSQITYNPANELGYRDDTYMYWTQTSHEEGMWAFKFNPEIAGNVPFLSPMFNDLVLSPLMRNLQKNKYIIEATKVMVGLIPMLKDAKSGQVKDMFAVESKTLGTFLQLIKSGIGDAISVGAAPFEDVKMVDFNVNQNNIQEAYNKNLSSSSGINSRLIYGSDKPNTVETLASIDVDSMLTKYVYPMFENFLDYNINSLTKKYKFKFKFEGTEFTTDRQNRLDTQMKLMEKGIVLPHKIAAAIGMDYHDMEMQLDEAGASGFKDKLIMILNASQMSAQEQLSNDKGGRPEKSVNELSDAGATTRENGGNIK